MSDPKTPIVAGHVYIRPLAASESDAATDWTDLGLTTSYEAAEENWYIGADSPLADGPPRFRTGLPGDERCGASGMQERVHDGNLVRRIYTPCLLAPDHGGDSHEGAAGRWLETGDPRGVQTVWPEPAAGQVAARGLVRPD
jgi:hypothetical protein